MEWPKELVQSLALRKTILFLGSGVSANSSNEKGKHPVTWRGLLEIINKKHIRQKEVKKEITNKIEAQDYLTAAEIIWNNVKEEKIDSTLKEEFSRPRFQAHDIHKYLFELDSRIVMTPNVDKIYETYAQQVTEGSTLIKNYYDADLIRVLRSQDPIVLKIHGSIDESVKMVFTRSQYAKARNDYTAFYKCLESLILNYTFLFVGCGLKDPDIQLIMENAAFTFPNGARHYFLLPEDEIQKEERKVEEKTRNIEFILFDKSDGYKELIEGLKDLIDLVEGEREIIASEMSWG